MEKFIDKKTCSQCFEEKFLTEFSKHTRDGYRSECKKCSSIQKQLYRIKYKDKITEYRVNYVKQYPYKVKAHSRVTAAIHSGQLVSAKICQAIGCNETKNIEGHHDDYNKPLDVRWFCRQCHRGFHG